VLIRVVTMVDISEAVTVRVDDDTSLEPTGLVALERVMAEMGMNEVREVVKVVTSVEGMVIMAIEVQDGVDVTGTTVRVTLTVLAPPQAVSALVEDEEPETPSAVDFADMRLAELAILAVTKAVEVRLARVTVWMLVTLPPSWPEELEVLELSLLEARGVVEVVSLL
jgi:hypothetical protein